MTWLFSWHNCLRPFMWLQLCWDSSVMWYHFNRGAVTRTPQASPRTDPLPLAPEGKTQLPLFIRCPRLLLIFLSVIWCNINKNCGSFTRSDYCSWGSVTEIISIRRWMLEKADLQPSGAPSLHMFYSARVCNNVSLVSIKLLNILATLCSLMDVWKSLLSFSSPITVTYISIN